uniref:SCP domain-containing protein n=1 Tax=Mesocestoides corti TaxID=53468 RepID=A0A5K3EHA6_MESCO
MLRLCTPIVLAWSVVGQAPTDEERMTFLEFHRNLREEVQPTASNMMLTVSG